MTIKLRALTTFADRNEFIVVGDIFEAKNVYQANAYVVKGLAEFVREDEEPAEAKSLDELAQTAATIAANEELGDENEPQPKKRSRKKGEHKNGE